VERAIDDSLYEGETELILLDVDRVEGERAEVSVDFLIDPLYNRVLLL
jgi:hypothetical protein